MCGGGSDPAPVEGGREEDEEEHHGPGHLEDAERVFRNVIAQEPGNLQAQEGLAALAEPIPTAPPATTAAGVGDDADSDRQRRVGILREYLARIERGRGLTTQ